jgi:hypothetical protein
MFARLNSRPMRSPTDASLSPLRTTAHGSGSMRIATPSSCRTCADYSLPVSPAHCEKLWTLPGHLTDGGRAVHNKAQLRRVLRRFFQKDART